MTATDLAKLDAALQRRQILRSNFLDQMWQPYRLANGSLGDFTAGWQYDDWNGHRVVGHIGAGMAAYSSLIKERVTLILLTNVQETKVWDLSREVLSLYVPSVRKR